MNVSGILVVIHSKRIYMYYCCYSCIVKYKYMYIYLLVCPFLMDHHFSAQSSREAINVHVRYLFWFIYYPFNPSLDAPFSAWSWSVAWLPLDVQISLPPPREWTPICQRKTTLSICKWKFSKQSFCCKKLYDHTVHKYNSIGLAKMKCNKFIHYKTSRNQN